MREMLKRTNSLFGLALKNVPFFFQDMHTYLGVALTKSCVRSPLVKTCCNLGGLGGLRGTLEEAFDLSDLTDTVA